MPKGSQRLCVCVHLSLIENILLNAGKEREEI